jgi:hypothetical protein
MKKEKKGKETESPAEGEEGEDKPQKGKPGVCMSVYSHMFTCVYLLFLCVLASLHMCLSNYVVCVCVFLAENEKREKRKRDMVTDRGSVRLTWSPTEEVCV